MGTIFSFGFVIVITFLLFRDLAILFVVTAVAVIVGKNVWGERGGFIGFCLTFGLATLYGMAVHTYHLFQIKPVCKTYTHLNVYYSPEEWKINTKKEENYIDEIKIPEKIIFHGREYKFLKENEEFNQIKIFINYIDYNNSFEIKNILIIDLKLKKALFNQGIVHKYRDVHIGASEYIYSNLLDRVLYNSFYENPCSKSISYISNYNLPVSF